jgi:hypothetical protein
MSTPWSMGPWKVDTQRSKKGTWAYINAPNGHWYWFAKVCVRLDGDDVESATGLANLRLMAASPEMIDALMQWKNAEAIGSDDELRNARISRELAIAKVMGDAGT